MSDLHSKQEAQCYDAREPRIDFDYFFYCLKRLRNWAAPGPDGIQGFWIKRFPALFDSLVHHCNAMLANGSLFLLRFPVGRTMLIPKSSNTTINYVFECSV